jgi:hypothetical protein
VARPSTSELQVAKGGLYDATDCRRRHRDHRSWR